LLNCKRLHNDIVGKITNTIATDPLANRSEINFILLLFVEERNKDGLSASGLIAQ